MQRSALTYLEHGALGALVFADEASCFCPPHVTTQEPTAPRALDVTTHGVVIMPWARVQRRTSAHPPHESPESPLFLRELYGENHPSQDQKAVFSFWKEGFSSRSPLTSVLKHTHLTLIFSWCFLKT